MTDSLCPPHTNSGPDPRNRRTIDPGDAEGIPGTELRLTREALGLSAVELADALCVNRRTLQRWETADHAPAWVSFELDFIVTQTLDWAEALTNHDGPVAIFHDGWHALDDGRLMPAAWWRATVGRALMAGAPITVEWEAAGYA